jgi:cyclic-di-GMP-binding protein
MSSPCRHDSAARIGENGAMSAFALPELSSAATPEFVDAQECKAWIEHVPLANVAAAQSHLHEQVREFNRLPTAAANRCAVMEALREPVNFVQIEQAKRFTNRALPMTEAELAVFQATDSLWDEMRVGYVRCLEAALNGEASMRAQAALVCQRALAYSGLKMFHHYRAYRQVPSRDWRGLHQVYGASEELEVAEEAVKDFLNRDVHDTSPRVAYARAVLMGMCNPNELAQRQLTFVAFLLERWAAKLEVTREPITEDDGIAALVVDLAGDSVPERVDGPAPRKSAALRYLDARKLAKSLRNRVGLLRKGESPAKLALGEDCVQPSCEQMLIFLFRQWCQAKHVRAAERRRPASPEVQACNDLAAIHYFISGSVFRQPSAATELTKKQREEIATFGRISTRDEEVEAQTFVSEPWEAADESAQGVRIIRRVSTPGKRYSHGQLVGVRPSDAKGFFLGQVRWLMTADNGDLHAGIRLLPGLPAACAVRATGLNVQNEKYVPALCLGPVPALQSPPCLVLTLGWFKPKRVLDLFIDSPVRARLTEVLERGLDFERVAFEVLP